MASITRARITHAGNDTVIQNELYVHSVPVAIGASTVFAFCMGIALARRDAAGGYVAIPLMVGAFNYFYGLFALHSAVRLTPAGLIVENLAIRHEFSWMAAPTVSLERGLRVRAYGTRPVACNAFADSNGARWNDYEGHRDVLEQIQEQRRLVRERFPTGSGEEMPPYRWRFQLPTLWLLPAAVAAFAAVYALGVLTNTP